MGLDYNIHAVLLALPEGGGSVIELGRQTVKGKMAKAWASAPEFYRDFGYTEYQCIDLRHGTIEHDLNQELHHTQQYDLVTNLGTAEHVFNQARVFRTIHELCKPEGVMLHALPGNAWGNHGLYRYTRAFLDALEAANHYERLDFSRVEYGDDRELFYVAWKRSEYWFEYPQDPMYFKETGCSP